MRIFSSASFFNAKVVPAIASKLWRVSPNTLTLLGIIPPIIFFIFMSYQAYWFALATTPGFILDVLDGAVARKTGKFTAFGGFFDSTLDRMSDAFVIAGFGAAGLVPWPLIAVALVSSILISYARTRAESAANNSFKLNIGLIERQHRLGILIGLTFLAALDLPFSYASKSLVEWGMWILVLLSIVTIIQRIFKAYQLLNKPIVN